MTKTLFTIAAAALGLSLMASCKAGKNDPGRTYAPDMYFSKAYEVYVANDLAPNGTSAMLPAEHTVPYGQSATGAADLQPWGFPNLSDADTASIMPAMRAFQNPVALTESGLAEGKKNYGIYCAICHGGNGQGKGYLVTGTKYSQAPANLMDSRLIDGASDAWYYHVMQYGKNSMGSYAYALTREQRWEIVHYIRSMQDQYLADQAAAAAEAAAAAPAPVESDTLAAIGL